MRVFADTNVVVDFLAKRGEFYAPASTLFEMARQGSVTCIVSSLTIINCAYVLRKHFGKELTLHKLRKLSETIEISPVDSDTIAQAFREEGNDFEDAVQYRSALACHADVIITRDKKGFQSFHIPTFTPEEFIRKCTS